MIQVQDLQFTYPGSAEPAVRGIDFTVAEGEIFGFLGPNGAGKSTTQKCLIGLLDRYEGQIEILGRARGDWDDRFYEQVGVGFENPNHYGKLSGRENLALFASLYAVATEDPEALLEMVDLSDAADQRVSDYSKGMKVRLGLARALLNRPRLLFLDEPTAGLDPISRRQVMDIVRRQQAEGRTVFLTTHDMDVADRLCDRVAFIVDGQIALIDAPRALRLQHGQRMLRVEYHASGVSADDGKPAGSAEFPLEGLGENADFLRLIREQAVDTMHTQEASLEDIFVRVTGRQLR